MDASVTSEPGDVRNATKLVLPGVGAFDNAMQRLRAQGLAAALDDAVMKLGTPLLGVCLGMQLLGERSEEGSLEGLGWIEAVSRRFPPSDLPVPHMGWNTVVDTTGHMLLRDQPDDPRFYFVHSYYVECRSETHVIATTEYGVRFASMIGKDHIMGVQFHPEKSHRFGMELLNQFAGL